jgi:hypothetical protein
VWPGRAASSAGSSRHYLWKLCVVGQASPHASHSCPELCGCWGNLQDPPHSTLHAVTDVFSEDLVLFTKKKQRGPLSCLYPRDVDISEIAL